MERVIDLTEVVAREVADYVAIGMYEADAYFLHDDAKRTYSFVSVPHDHWKNALVVMFARVTAENKVVIETDHTDRPLYKALIEAGVPRSQIIRAYAGKTEPEP